MCIGEGLVGRIIASASPQWMFGINEMHPNSFVRSPGAKALNIRTACGVPVPSGVTALTCAAAICFYSSSLHDHVEETLDFISQALVHGWKEVKSAKAPLRGMEKMESLPPQQKSWSLRGVVAASDPPLVPPNDRLARSLAAIQQMPPTNLPISNVALSSQLQLHHLNRSAGMKRSHFDSIKGHEPPEKRALTARVTDQELATQIIAQETTIHHTTFRHTYLPTSFSTTSVPTTKHAQTGPLPQPYPSVSSLSFSQRQYQDSRLPHAISHPEQWAALAHPSLGSTVLFTEQCGSLSSRPRAVDQAQGNTEPKEPPGKISQSSTKDNGFRYCEHPGCKKHAQGATTKCIAHGGGRRCTHPGCVRGARGKFFCAAHGGGKRCQTEGCTKSAVGGSNHCVSHGGGKRCQAAGCPKAAQSASSYCVAHGGGRKCAEPGCTKVARGRTMHCAGHGGGVRCVLKAARVPQSVPLAFAGVMSQRQPAAHED